MKSGDRWMVYIPSDLGYGAEGTPGGPIPPNAPLQFEVELVDVLQ
jgi:peptidylprolyl isomerase